MAQLTPLRVKEAGLPVLPVEVAWKPTSADSPAGSAPLNATLRAEIWPLEPVYVAFQPLVMV